MKLLSFDLETSGTKPEYALQPWRARQGLAWVTSFATCEKIDGALLFNGCVLPDKRTLAAILEQAIATKSRIVGWNITFDVAWLIARGLEDLVFRCKWLDAMRLWRHYFIEPEWSANPGKKRSYGLKTYVTEYLPWLAGYEEGVDYHDSSPENLQKLLRYNKDDAHATLLASQDLLEKLTPDQRRCVFIEAESIPLIARANIAGMLIDTSRVQDQRSKQIEIAEQTFSLLERHIARDNLNMNSSQQLAAVLYDDWRLPCRWFTETGTRSTDKEALHELALIDPRAKLIRDHREAVNLGTKFCQTILNSVEYNNDGCTHPEAILFGTYSGRLTYSSKQSHKSNSVPRKAATICQTGFALHQMKRGPEFRSAIIAPPGYDLVEFDADGQEFKWMAIASHDETMLSLCSSGEDAHSYMAARIYHEDYVKLMALVGAGEAHAKVRRQMGKVANLSLQYRTSARKLMLVARVDYGIPLELSEAERVRATYYTTYPGVPAYHSVQIARTKRLGYVETFAGRRVQVIGNWDGPHGWSMGSTAINYRIQGTGADQKYLALAVLKPYIIQNGAHFAWDMHDGLYFYVPEGASRRIASEIKPILNNLPYKRAWGFEPPIALPWSCKIGPSWGGLKEWKE
jgi:DNA polymerase I-like protein with 3'-5' exonuclease and polymerase domains